ncbi:MAG: hypothetical protein HZC40_22135 [Chloroflexi bacterium]|nr:hypothetical protein [Chloroflexota bacterium]
MVNIRRAYVFLVCIFSLQPVTWAIIALGRALIADRENISTEATAFQIAVIVIGLPIFLAHWVWAQRVAARDQDERASFLRRAYLYLTLAAFLAPFLATVYDLLTWSFGIFAGRTTRDLGSIAPTEAILSDLATLPVLGALWLYHQFVVLQDARTAPDTGINGAIRRAYILLFSASGLTLTLVAAVRLIEWILFRFGETTGTLGRTPAIALADQLALLLIGLPVWLIFWIVAQKLFASLNEDERESVLRKVYLYLSVFVTVLIFVTNAAFILAGIFRRALGLRVDEDARTTIAILIGVGVVWAYHAFVVRGDARAAQEEPRQAGIRRLYEYLVAGIGLAALLIGIGGDVSVVITAASEGFRGNDLKEQTAWFSAALIAGMIVWFLPWQRAQIAAIAPLGADERRSIVRKIYLFVYLFVATMTILATAVYIVFRPLSLLLGTRFSGNLISDLAHALAYGLIGIALWLYHGWALRGDGARNRAARIERLAGLRVAIIGGTLSDAIASGLQREFPGLALDTLDLANAPADLSARLANAGLIVGPWTIALDPRVAASPARKLLIPTKSESWDWVGVESARAFAPQTVRAVKQIVEGETLKSGGNPVALIIGIIVLICILIQVLFSLIGFLGMLMN